MRSKWKVLAGLSAVSLASTLAACGGSTGDGEPEPVDHATARQAVQTNTSSASANLQASLTYLRGADMIGEWVDQMDGGDELCAADTTDGGSIEPIDGTDCGPSEPMEEQVDSGTGELLEFLDTRIFVDANIEQESQTEVVYLIGGESLCQPEDFETAADRQTCVSDVDQIQLRLAVTSMAPGDVDIEVLVGPSRYNPVDLELHRDMLAAEVDLAEARSTTLFVGSVLGEDVSEVPDTMRGKLRGELRHSQSSLTGTFSVMQDVVIAGGDYDIRLDRAQPAGRVTVDSAARSVDALLSLNAVDLRFPVTETDYYWDDATGEETVVETSYQVAAHLAGASFQASFTEGDRRIDVTNIGLGAGPSTLDIDGHRVMDVDLNRNHGRTFDVSLVSAQDGLEVEFSPAFDLELLMQFAAVQDTLDGVQSWMLDDLLRITLDGAAKPAVLVNDNGVEVLAGNLHMSSTAANISHDVPAGQCLLPPAADEPTVVDSTGTSTDGEVIEHTNTHPLEELAVGACE